MLIGLSKFTWMENWWFVLPRDTKSHPISEVRKFAWTRRVKPAMTVRIRCLHALRFMMRRFSHWWWHFPGRNAQRLVNEITSCWWWSTALELSTMRDAMDSTHRSVNPWFTGTQTVELFDRRPRQWMIQYLRFPSRWVSSWRLEL